MAQNIKGITIEINGRTTKLQEALKRAKTSTNKLNSEMREINRLLKFNPNSVVGLTQKQQVLNEKIGTTKEKLEALKQAQEKALASGEIDKASKEYRQLEREITEATSQLKLFQREQREVVAQSSRLGQVSARLDDISKKAHKTADKFRGVSLATGLVLGASLKIGADFEKEMSKVSAISGAVGEQLEALKKKARDMGSKTEFSAKQSAEAMNYMAMAGWKTGEIISGLDGIMNLASASGEDLASVSDIVTDGLTAFKLSAKDSGRFADVLATVSSNANTNVALMGETFKYVAPVAGALGFNIEETAEAIGLMANVGIKGTQAGTSLRTIMNNLSKDFTITGQKLGTVKIATTNTDGSMRSLRDILKDTRKAFSELTESEKAQTSEALVGKNAMSGFLALMDAGEADIKKLQKALDNSTGSAEKMASTMRDNLYGDITQLKSSSEELALSLGEGLRPTIRAVTKGLKAFTDFLSSMPKGFKTFIATSMLATASIYPLGKGIGYMTGSASKVIKFFSVFKGGSLDTAKETSKLASIITKFPKFSIASLGLGAVTTLISIMKSAYNEMHRVRNEINAIDENSHKKLSAIENTSRYSEMYLEKLKNLMAVENKSATQKKEIQAIVEKLNENVKDLNLTYDEENDKLNEGIDVIGRKIQAYKQLAKAEAYKETQKEYYKEQFKLEEEQLELIKQKIDLEGKLANARATNDGVKIAEYTKELGIIESKLEDVSDGIDKTRDKAEQMGNMQFFAELLSQAQMAGIKVPQSLEEGIRAGYIKVPQSIDELNALINSELADLLLYAKSKGVGVPKELSDGIKNGSIDVSTASERLRGIITEKLNINTEQLGINIGKGLERGMNLAAYSAGLVAQNMVNHIYSVMNKTALTRSPSRRSMQLGKYIGQGLEIGMNRSASSVNKSAKGLVSGVFENMKVLNDGLSNASTGMNASLNNTVFHQSNIDYNKLGFTVANIIKNLDLGIKLNGRELARGLEGIGVKFV